MVIIIEKIKYVGTQYNIDNIQILFIINVSYSTAT